MVAYDLDGARPSCDETRALRNALTAVVRMVADRTDQTFIDERVSLSKDC